MDKTCEIHNVTMTQREGKFGPFWSHKEGEGWCNGKPKDYKATWENRKKDFLDAVEPTKAPTKAVSDDSAVWQAKDRMNMAQSALKAAAEIVAAEMATFKEMPKGNQLDERFDDLKEKNYKWLMEKKNG